MKAFVSTADGAFIRHIAAPVPKACELLVQVKAASLNRADLNVLDARDGRVIGMEWAGEVVETGRDVSDFQPGDRVMCTGSAGYAEFAVADSGRAIKMPEHLDFSFQEATVLTLALQAMHDAIVTQGRIAANEVVLIHGASSGVGLMGLQIAKLRGAKLVIGTSTNPQRRSQLAAFGADLVLDPSDSAWSDKVLDATGGEGANLIVDQVAGPGFKQLLRAAALGGRVVNLGRLGGLEGAFDFDLHAMKRLTYIGVTFRTRTTEEIRNINQRMLNDLGHAIFQRNIKLPIDSVFPLEQAESALKRMRSNNHFGKIVLTF